MPLKPLWEPAVDFLAAPSPVYGEHDGAIRYAVRDLLWPPAAVLVRGRLILLYTCLELQALDLIGLYGLRFKTWAPMPITFA